MNVIFSFDGVLILSSCVVLFLFADVGDNTIGIFDESLGKLSSGLDSMSLESSCNSDASDRISSLLSLSASVSISFCEILFSSLRKRRRRIGPLHKKVVNIVGKNHDSLVSFKNIIKTTILIQNRIKI